ncbi:MAG TPA: hypothetical protein VNE62_06250 [Actinomycetota bacterium]|nr:hypothetical protein [Actinomycetota bacterium]
MAKRTKAKMHPLISFEEAAGWVDRPAHERPAHALDEKQTLRLVELLESFTRTPEDCVFALWEGYGPTSVRYSSMPRVHLYRPCVLFRGPMGAIGSFHFEAPQGGHEWWVPPNMWWPSDRSWFVASDLDYTSTFVGGSRECVDTIQRDPSFEVFEVGPTDSTFGC